MLKTHLRLPLLAYMTLLAMTLVALPVAAQQAQYYVLDGFGGVHAGGGAPIITPATPYFGFDIAKDVVYVPGTSGGGILVLDGFGGVHAGGALPSSSANPRTPYWGFNIARAIAPRTVPPRAAGLATANLIELGTTSATFTPAASVVMNAPDDGFLMVNGSTSVFCTTAVAGSATVEVRLGVDSTAGTTASSHWATFPDCTAASPGVIVPVESIAITQAFFVSAGSHTVHLLARKAGGSLALGVDSRSVTVVFIDQNAVGSS